MFALAVCVILLTCVVLKFVSLYFVIKMYRRTEQWEPRAETRGHVVGSVAERRRVFTRNENVSQNPQSVPHNHHNPIEHDERQGKCESFLFSYFSV